MAKTQRANTDEWYKAQLLSSGEGICTHLIFTRAEREFSVHACKVTRSMQLAVSDTGSLAWRVYQQAGRQAVKNLCTYTCNTKKLKLGTRVRTRL